MMVFDVFNIVHLDFDSLKTILAIKKIMKIKKVSKIGAVKAPKALSQMCSNLDVFTSSTMGNLSQCMFKRSLVRFDD